MEEQYHKKVSRTKEPEFITNNQNFLLLKTPTHTLPVALEQSQEQIVDKSSSYRRLFCLITGN